MLNVCAFYYMNLYGNESSETKWNPSPKISQDVLEKENLAMQQKKRQVEFKFLTTNADK